jgi:hypothetical protein
MAWPPRSAAAVAGCVDLYGLNVPICTRCELTRLSRLPLATRTTSRSRSHNTIDALLVKLLRRGLTAVGRYPAFA